MNTIQIAEKTYTAPQKWSEMEAWHLLLWTKIVQKDINRTDAFALATMLFYKIKPRLYFKLQPAHHVQLKDTLAFLAEGNHLSNWLIPLVKPWPWLTYIGPSNRLSTSTIQEFRLAESFFMAYEVKKDERFLDQLIATLYRKKGANNLQMDERMQISEVLVNKHAGKMSRLDKITRASILFNYEGCRNFIFQKYPSIFKVGSGKRKSKELPDLEGIIQTVAGGKFGAFNETKDTNLYLFFNHLADEIEAAKKLKK